MKNSPSIYQWYVACILSLLREMFQETIILYYMDDVLICTKKKTYLNIVFKRTIRAIEEAGFEIREDKIQYTCPWTYLGLRIHKQTIVPQQLTIWDDLKTLWDLYQLCGSIN